MRKFSTICFILVAYLTLQNVAAQKVAETNAGTGWAGNSVNTVVFRKNSLASFKEYQFISYYDSTGSVVLGKRKFGQTAWELKKTPYKGNIKDAHNSISIIIDGDGYLHIAWDHHNSILHYCRSKEPLSLELTEMMPMTGSAEQSVSYPEFHQLPGKGLLFFYRDGGSGNGNMIINSYDALQKKWNRVQTNLLDGEGKRNAYWQAHVNNKGSVYLSWVWRETPDVASNHDLCFALSKDGGITWEKSTGEKYTLPITAANAEYACAIPQRSELINQTSMYADEKGRIVIAGYWKDQGSTIPQYHLVYNLAKKWEVLALDFRKTPFSLSGTGSKKIPVARPQVILKQKGRSIKAWMIFRDEERGSKVSVAVIPDLVKNKYAIIDLTRDRVGAWEPSFDTGLWNSKKIISLFVQHTEQADGEGLTTLPPQAVRVLDWKPE